MEKEIMAAGVNQLPVLPMGLTEAEIVAKANQLVESLYDDATDPMASIIIAECISGAETFLETIRKHPKFINLVRDIIGMDKEGYKTSSGSTITQAETGTKYDFSGDSRWLTLKTALTDADNAIKAREKFLKSIEPGAQVADGDSGELATAPTKTSTSNYKISLKKK